MFHPLQSDEDAPIEALMTARAHAVLAWGLLQGSLAHVPPEVAHHFCCSLIRLALIDALAQTGGDAVTSGGNKEVEGASPAEMVP